MAEKLVSFYQVTLQSGRRRLKHVGAYLAAASLAPEVRFSCSPRVARPKDGIQGLKPIIAFPCSAPLCASIHGYSSLSAWIGSIEAALNAGK